ncbi:MAG: allantoicase [Gemmatimonadota bacterium]
MTESDAGPGAARALDGLIDLAAERIGGRAVDANDEFFAPKENLLKASEPVFEPDRYTDRGKWMDGWETRRRRSPGHDWCVVELGVPGRIRRVIVDTRHFRGNHPEACSLDASPRREGDEWRELLSRVALRGDAPNEFPIDADAVFARVRLNIHPDGGVARLRVLGEPRGRPSAGASGHDEGRVDLASALLGGAPVACSDRFFSDPRNLLLPGPPLNMGDGWETRRRRGPGHDWVVIRLGAPGIIEEVEVDTTHFKGNYPAACSLEGCSPPPAEIEGPVDWDARPWRELVRKSELGPDARHVFRPEVEGVAVSHVRFNIYPDGGVARLRLRGRPADGGGGGA